MNNAIKLAIEKGGYRGGNQFTQEYKRHYADPLFWQALGKALGWKGLVHKEDGVECALRGRDPVDFTYEKWQYHAHQYFDLVLTGGDTEKFWKDLIN